MPTVLILTNYLETLVSSLTDCCGTLNVTASIFMNTTPTQSLKTKEHHISEV
jgi:hypothetical protein